MNIGTYYHPEQWPREQWERDFDNMERLGLQVVHLASFAWQKMEPSEGKIQLDWLQEALEMVQQRGLRAILGTPTATPPIWLVQQSPEILPVGRYGAVEPLGGRRQYNPLAPAMVLASKRIVTAMAEHFGEHPAVIGWQVDSEYACLFDQSELTHQVFRVWLEERYKTLDALNRAWGAQGYYTDFEQLHMPVSREAEDGNPHQRLDASRFWSWAFAQFNKVQADILKPRIGRRFITTNLMALHQDVNPDDLSPDLSLYAWGAYPTGGSDLPPATDQTFRMGDPAQVSLVHDQMASYTGRWGLTKMQPGRENRAAASVLLYPGAIRLWIWNAWAHGAEFATAYRFRQPRCGVEMFHQALIGADGVTPSAAGRECSLAASEISRIDPAKLIAAPAASAPSGKRGKSIVSDLPVVGLYLDFEQLWNYSILPQARRWDYGQLLTNLYGAVLRLGQRVQIIRPGQPIPRALRLLILPGVQMVDDKTISNWSDYVAGGGNLLITCRTALMDKTGQFFEGPPAAPILPLIGGSIEAHDGLPEGVSARMEMDDIDYPWSIWGDLLYAEEGTHVLARYADQFYAGAAAVMQKTHGKNASVTYCGVFPEAPFADALLEVLLRQFKVPVNPTPRRVHLLKRGLYNICLNFQDTTYEVPAGKNAQFLVGSRTMEPADVAVWEE